MSSYGDLTGTIATVIPAHNSARTIVRAVRSVQRQTVAVEEIILVDDGSTDNTLEVIRELAELDHRIRCLNRPTASGGPALPRNLGIAAASSDWIAFLDADDEWLPHKIARQKGLLDGRCDVVYSNTLARTSSAWRPWNLVPIPDDASLSVLAYSNQIPILSALVSKQRVVDVGGFDESPDLNGVDDWDLWIRIALEGGTFYGIEEPLCRYYRTEGSISSKLETHLSCQKRMLQKLAALHPEVPDLQLSLQQFAERASLQRQRHLRDRQTEWKTLPVTILRIMLDDGLRRGFPLVAKSLYRRARHL